MTFEEVLDQAMAMLQRRGRLTYRTLQLHFQLDDAHLEALKDELIYGQRLARYGDHLTELLPLLAALLSLPLSTDQYPPLTLTPQQQKQKTLQALLTLVLELAERQPVLFILEDLHWTDPSTLEWLALLMAQVPTARLFLLMTCRPTFRAPWEPRSYVTQVPINRLQRAQVEQMVARLTAEKPLPAEVLAHIVAKADGVPLFVEEMTKAILESGCLRDTDGRYALLAYHYTAAGRPEPAMPYWQRAGERAVERSAHLEAVSHFTTGIALLTSLPETSARARQALTLHIALGAALQVAKGFAAPEVEQAYAQARALCQQVGETPELVPVLLGLWRFYHSRSQLHIARELGDMLLRLAQRVDDPALAVIAHYAVGVTWWWLGALPAARRHLEAGIARYTPDQRRAPVFRIGHDLGVACQANAAMTLWLLGYPAQALARAHGPWRWPMRWRIPIVWRLRSVWRPTSLCFAGTWRPHTSRPRSAWRSRPRRVFPSGRPWARVCAAGR